MAFSIITGGLLVSCGNKKNADNLTDSLKEEAVKESFTPGEKETALDTLQEIDEMVEAVEQPIKGINGTPYNNAFFLNPENKGDKASSTKYAQTSSGLRYVIVNEGKGKSPKATDTVTVHYVGQFTNGEEFDSSISRGEPAKFPLNGVIPGWTEGLQLMKEGGIAVFYLPSSIAYGENGMYDPRTGMYAIPPNSPLIFWVQLINVD